MNTRLVPWKMVVLLLAVLCVSAPRAGAQQRRYRTVTARDLLDRPQNYWARSIVFQDTLVEVPSGREYKLDGVRYAVFSTRTLGTCYLAKPLEPVMAQVPEGRTYMFTGTVLQHGSRYFVIVESFTGTVDSEEIPAELKNLAASGQSLLVSQSSQPVAEVLRTVRESLFAYAKEKGLTLEQVLDPTSAHAPHVMELIRLAVRDQEQKKQSSSAEILAQYVYGVIAQNQPAPRSVEAGTNAVEGEAPTNEPSVAGPVEPAQPKMSWWQRRSQARAQEAALKAEQRREADEAAAIATAENVAPAAGETNGEPAVTAPPTQLTRAQRKELERQRKEEERRQAEDQALKEASGNEPAEQPPVVELPPNDVTPSVEPLAAPAVTIPDATNPPEASTPVPPPLTRAERRELEKQKKAELKAERERVAVEKREQARREKEAAEAARQAEREAQKAAKEAAQQTPANEEAVPMFKAPAPDSSLEDPTKPYFSPPDE
jgi:hypothetical protein